MQRRWWVLGSLGIMLLVIAGSMVGCGFGGTGTIDSVLAPGGSAPAYTNRAAVRFTVTLSDDDPGRVGLHPTVRGNGQDAVVSLKLIGIKVGNTADNVEQRIEVHAATATVVGGVADLSLTGLPTLPSVAQIQITGGSIGGLTSFHGAADLQAGDNRIAVNPFGSRLRHDVTAHILESALTSRAMVAAARAGMVEDVKGVVGGLASRTATALGVNERGFNRYAERLNPSTMTKIQLSEERNAILGWRGGSVLWSKGNLDIWSQGELWSLPAIDILFKSVLRHAIDGYGYVTSAHSTHFPFAVLRLDAANGNRQFFVRHRGQCDAAFVLPDGSIVVGGTHHDLACPVLFCWDGRANGNTRSDADTTEAGLKWSKYFTDLQGTAAEPYPAVLSVQYDPAGIIMAAVRDAQNQKVKHYRFNAANGEQIGQPVVQIPNQPPTVAITTPAGNAQVAEGSPVTLGANAQDADGLITRVEFYIDGALVGAATQTPFLVSWARPLPGTHVLSARAYDNAGSFRNSQDVTFSVGQRTNVLPTVSISVPAEGASFEQGTTITIIADANDADGTIAKVEFFDGATKLGERTTSPFAYTWSGASVGNHALIAKATDNVGGSRSSTPVNIVVGGAGNKLPTVTIVNPAPGFSTLPGVPFDFRVTASDEDGTIAKVELYLDSDKIYEETTGPYVHNMFIEPYGVHTLTAKATDNAGGIRTVTTTVVINTTAGEAPNVMITSPMDASSHAPGSTLGITCQATVSNGNVTRVEVYNGNTMLGQSTQSPFLIQWNNLPVGNWTLTARAFTDTGTVGVSSPVTITVAPRPVISWISPFNNSIFTAPAIVFLSVDIQSPEPINKLEFFSGSTMLVQGYQSATSWHAQWDGAEAGDYSLVARVTTSSGATYDSAPISVSIAGNSQPTVAIVSPTSSEGVTPNQTVTISITATDPDGSVSSVELFDSGAWLGNALWTSGTTYTFAWTPQPGRHVLTARAYDNSGAYGDSAPVTIELGDDEAPTVLSQSRTPEADATGVSISTPITFYFSEPMNLGTVNENTVRMTTADGVAVPGGLTVMNEWYLTAEVTRVTFVPQVPLSYGQVYRVSVTGGDTGVTDIVGNRMAAEASWTFTTEAQPTLDSREVGTYFAFGGYTWVKIGHPRKLFLHESNPNKPADRPYDPNYSGLFDPSGEVPDNIGAYLNSAGTIHGTAGFLNTIPTADQSKIEMSSWERAAYYPRESQSAPSNPVQAKVGLLTMADWNFLNTSDWRLLDHIKCSAGFIWTMTPVDTNNSPTMWMVDASGYSYGPYDSRDSYGVRPVINLIPGLAISAGTGDLASPYILSE